LDIVSLIEGVQASTKLVESAIAIDRLSVFRKSPPTLSCWMTLRLAT
jgi:hypothetical protein